jgi:winged helix DNA-binding protein
MRPSDIPHARLHHQRLTSPQFKKPVDVVRWLGAVQAQEYAAAKWGIGQRMRRATDDAIERAFAEGSILRTHVLRPTWHFVAPEDIRWMLELTGPRVKTTIASYARHVALDDAAFKRSRKVLATALRDGRHLTRGELRQVFQRAGIPADGLRAVLLLIGAELDGLICSGPRTGKAFTYALLEERVPTSRALTRDEALMELARRYFTSRGPATLQDFVWWSGLTTADARSGIEMAGSDLSRHVIDGSVCWLPTSRPAAPRPAGAAHLLPVYDEYLVAYKDRSAVVDSRYCKRGTNVLFGSTVVVEGLVVGTWNRAQSGNQIVVNVRPFAAVAASARRAVADAIRRYGVFLGEELHLRWLTPPRRRRADRARGS